jgi:hypothetical protein
MILNKIDSRSNCIVVKFRVFLMIILMALYSNFVSAQDRLPKDPIPLYGNSTTVAVGTVFSNNDFATLDIGRTYGRIFSSGGAGLMTSHTLGMGVISLFDFQSIEMINLYYQFDFSTIPQLLPISARLDFMSSPNQTNLYVKPSIGLSFHPWIRKDRLRDFKMDLMYGYQFNTNTDRNSLNVRLRYIPRFMDKWPDTHID